MKFRAKRLDNGELVEGYYMSDTKHTMPHVIYYNGDFIEIDPTTLAMETGQTDKNGTMIYGSVPVEGIGMSKGGDVLKDTGLVEKNTFICFYGVLDTPSFGVANIETSKRDTVDSFSKYFTITGKQYEI